MSDLDDAYERLLADAAGTDVVRAIERGGSAATLWERLDASGFLDALLPEVSAGAGLSLGEIFPLLVAEGRHALPVPAAHTMLARAALVAAGQRPPSGPIVIASSTRVAPDGGIACVNTPCGAVAEWVVASLPDGWLLLPTAEARRQGCGVHGSLRADLHWGAPARASEVPGAVDWQAVGAAVAAAQLAGAMQRVLQLTVAFANERVQFGKSIGKFQALQHQIAVMAEHVTAAHMAAEIGCTARGAVPERLRAAVAKARASEAATFATSIGHAVHGAIGVTAELDLQLYTRRLHEWRADFGSERYWNTEVGRALLAADAQLSLDFMRDALIPANDEISR